MVLAPDDKSVYVALASSMDVKIACNRQCVGFSSQPIRIIPGFSSQSCDEIIFSEEKFDDSPSSKRCSVNIAMNFSKAHPNGPKIFESRRYGLRVAPYLPLLFSRQKWEQKPLLY